MARYYCTNDYEGLEECFYNRFLSVNAKYGFTLESAIKELDDFVKGYKQEKKRYDYWTSAKPIENPKNSKEHFYNSVLRAENTENSLYKSNMETQIKQFTAMENAIRRWLPESGMTEKEQAKVIKKIEVRKAKLV